MNNHAQRFSTSAQTGLSPRHVLITGASGLIGRRLSAFLSARGYQISHLVRRRPLPDAAEIEWDPARGTIDEQALEGIQAVVHLAGENIASGRWTSARKAAILTSRVEGTKLLAGAISRVQSRPRVLISGSAIGYYGNRYNEELSEQSSAGTGFLADVCRQWEAATLAVREAGIRVMHLRTGVVLAADGGVLHQMLTPFRLGLGGPVGSGQQYMSWIALDDLVGCIHHLIFDETIAGPVNAVAPRAVTNADFARALGRVLHRPTLLRLPAFLVRLVWGEMGQTLLLEGARVCPAKLQAAGFEFLYPELESALRYELGL